MELMRYVRAQWDRVVGVGALIVGIIAIVLGYYGVSGTPHVAAQLPYFISGGVFGLFMLGVACMAWLSADLRDEWRELHAIRTVLEQQAGPPVHPDGAPINGNGHGSSASGDYDNAPNPYRGDLIDPTPVGVRADADDLAYAASAAGDAPEGADSQPTGRRTLSSGRSRGNAAAATRTRRASAKQ